MRNFSGFYFCFSKRSRFRDKHMFQMSGCILSIRQWAPIAAGSQVHRSSEKRKWQSGHCLISESLRWSLLRVSFGAPYSRSDVLKGKGSYAFFWTFKIREGVDENKILLVYQMNKQHSDILFDFQSLPTFNKQQCKLCRISHSKNVKPSWTGCKDSMMKCLYIGIFSVLAWVIGERFAKFFPSIYTTGNFF